MIVGGIEAGGTKFVCLVATTEAGVIAETRLPTRGPAETVADAVAFLRAQDAAAGPLDAIGIAAFGPLELRPDEPGFGRVLSTPKPCWSHADLVGPFRTAFDVPVGIDTDVNGAALAERLWGAARGLDDVLYLTIGTGIGGGALVAGRPLHGLVHPEIGHVSVPREAGDDFAGICPFHGDCLEGLACGPAMEARWGAPAQHLQGETRERAVAMEAGYLASGIRNAVYALAPQRVVIGGGVAELPGLIPQVRTRLAAAMHGYPGLQEHLSDGFVVPAGLGLRAGPLGAVAVGLAAAGK
jgi:fructokinase